MRKYEKLFHQNSLKSLEAYLKYKISFRNKVIGFQSRLCWYENIASRYRRHCGVENRHVPIRIGYCPVKKAALEGVLDGKT